MNSNFFSMIFRPLMHVSSFLGHKKIDDKILLRLASSVCKCMQELETDKSDNQSISNVRCSQYFFALWFNYLV